LTKFEISTPTEIWHPSTILMWLSSLSPHVRFYWVRLYCWRPSGENGLNRHLYPRQPNKGVKLNILNRCFKHGKAKRAVFTQQWKKHWTVPVKEAASKLQVMISLATANEKTRHSFRNDGS
jgi:hypothetical protein